MYSYYTITQRLFLELYFYSTWTIQQNHIVSTIEIFTDTINNKS